MAAKDGKVFYWKAFGNHEYGMEKTWQPTRKNDVFDLASITKIGATLMATMNLEEEGRIHLDGKFSSYVTDASQTNKKDILRSEEHTSELQSLMRTAYAIFCLEKNNKTPAN